MGLSCECDWDWDGDNWAYYQPVDLTLLQSPRKRCCSCKKVIKSSEVTLKFERAMQDENGDEYYIDPWFMCEECGEIYLNLEALGYCMYIDQEPMKYYLSEYHKLTGFKHDRSK